MNTSTTPTTDHVTELHLRFLDACSAYDAACAENRRRDTAAHCDAQAAALEACETARDAWLTAREAARDTLLAAL